MIWTTNKEAGFCSAKRLLIYILIVITHMPRLVADSLRVLLITYYETRDVIVPIRCMCVVVGIILRACVLYRSVHFGKP